MGSTININSLKKSIEKIRNYLKKEGECLIISYDHECPDYKIHIHITKPINIFLKKLNRTFGEIKNIKILDLKTQNENYIESILNK